MPCGSNLPGAEQVSRQHEFALTLHLHHLQILCPACGVWLAEQALQAEFCLKRVVVEGCHSPSHTLHPFCVQAGAFILAAGWQVVITLHGIPAGSASDLRQQAAQEGRRK